MWKREVPVWERLGGGGQCANITSLLQIWHLRHYCFWHWALFPRKWPLQFLFKTLSFITETHTHTHTRLLFYGRWGYVCPNSQKNPRDIRGSDILPKTIARALPPEPPIGCIYKHVPNISKHPSQLDLYQEKKVTKSDAHFWFIWASRKNVLFLPSLQIISFVVWTTAIKH